jgi:hypothetical protein
MSARRCLGCRAKPGRSGLCPDCLAELLCWVQLDHRQRGGTTLSGIVLATACTIHPVRFLDMYIRALLSNAFALAVY